MSHRKIAQCRPERAQVSAATDCFHSSQIQDCPEAKEKRRQKILGQKRSQEVREKISGENNPFYGQTHTIEAREKMSQSKINKTPEQKLETYIKFYISRMGYEPSEEQKQNKLQEYIKKKEK